MRLSVWPAHSRPFDEVLAVARGGRGSAAIERSTQADAGADELIVPDWNLGRPERALDALGRFLAVARGA